MKKHSEFEISDLEREIELEMDDSSSMEHEADDDPSSMEYEADDDSGVDHESESDSDSTEEMEFEGMVEDSESETSDSDGADRDATDDFAERFYELSMREFENEPDLDREIGGILNEMERQYFWGSLKKLAKKGLKYGAKRLLKKARGFAKGVPGFKSITQLARGNLKGALSSLAKQGLSAALRMNPATAVGMTALKGLGFDPLGDSEANRGAWNNYTAVAREAYDQLAANLNESSDQPVEASRQAAAAFQTALQRAPRHRGGGGMSRNGKVHRIRVRAGETITLIIEGAYEGRV